jgi:hypothetical protein
MRFLQSYQTKNGVAFLELTNEQYGKAKGTVKEVEISNRQFEAANGVRLTADGTITTIDSAKLAKNLDSVQGQNLREPRLVTPTTAEFVRQSEIIKGIAETEQIRQDLGLISNRAREKNVGFANIKLQGQESRVVAHSGEISKNGTVSSPQKRFFKTNTTREGNTRQFEVELKILEDFANKHFKNSKEIKGEIYLFTELPPCLSCTEVFQQFREMFPNVRLEVASGEFRPIKIKRQ